MAYIDVGQGSLFEVPEDPLVLPGTDLSNLPRLLGRLGITDDPDRSKYLLVDLFLKKPYALREFDLDRKTTTVTGANTQPVVKGFLSYLSGEFLVIQTDSTDVGISSYAATLSSIARIAVYPPEYKEVYMAYQNALADGDTVTWQSVRGVA